MPTNRALEGDERQFQAPEGFLAQAALSGAIRVGEVIFTSGQVGIDDHGAVVAGGIGEQTRVCLQNIQRILEGFDAALQDVVQVRVFLVDFTGYDDYNRVYREFFTTPFPTRSTIGTPQLALGAEIEIEAIAIRRSVT
jgi:2-iminobutanoate/2-iminopropanoate deaminase